MMVLQISLKQIDRSIAKFEVSSISSIEAN